MLLDDQETSYWNCRVCGAGNTCVPGDESIALAIHMTIHPAPERSK